MAISRCVKTCDQLFRQDHVLDVHAARLHFVLVQLLADVLQRALLHLLAGLDELHRRHALERVAEVIAHGRLQHLVDQIGNRADHADDARGGRVGHVDLHDQLDAEDEAFAALGHDFRQPLVELVGLADRLRPVEAQDGRGHVLGLVAAGVDGILAGPQRFLPDAAMAGPDDRPELEGGPGRVLRSAGRRRP